MTQIHCTLAHDREETLMAYLYDDIEPAARARFEQHLAACERCRVELRSLGGVRAQLARWAPPEPNIARAAGGPSLPAAVAPAAARSWWRDIPAWAQVAAALLVFGVSAGIANMEVRYDEINGVSYTKGCYTGQETVARLHFRGHTNRHLVGLTWQDAPDTSNADIAQDTRTVGRVSSVAWLGALDHYVGLGLVRRDTDLSRPVIAAGAPARAAELPMHLAS